MAARQSRTAEIVRICIMSVVSALLVWLGGFFWQQDWLLGGLIISVDKDSWITGTYNFWAILVWGFSTALTFLWYVLACYAPDRGPKLNLQLQIIWAIFSALTLIPTAIFAFLFTGGVDWLVGVLCVLFFFLVGCVGYWLGTAVNSPAPFTYIPPLSLTLRNLLGLS